MEQISGVVLEVGKQDYLVLSNGNRYVRLRLAEPNSNPNVGDIVQGYPVNAFHTLGNRKVSRIWAYVASILITIVFSGYQVYALTAAPSAYVSLDMAPSIQLVLNSRGKVIDATSYNNQGKEILQQVSLDTLPVEQALQTLVKAAADYPVTPNENRVAILTYTAAPYLNNERLSTVILDTLKQEEFNGDLVIKPIDRDFLNKAAQSQVSPGEQLLVDLSANTDVPLTSDELKNNNVPSVLEKHGLKLESLINNLHDGTANFSTFNTSQNSDQQSNTGGKDKSHAITYSPHTLQLNKASDQELGPDQQSGTTQSVPTSSPKSVVLTVLPNYVVSNQITVAATLVQPDLPTNTSSQNDHSKVDNSKQAASVGKSDNDHDPKDLPPQEKSSDNSPKNQPGKKSIAPPNKKDDDHPSNTGKQVGQDNASHKRS